MGPDGGALRYAPAEMSNTSDPALGQTLALIATFGGIGLFVNLLIFYIIAQVLGERKQNQEYHQGGGELR